VGLVAEAAFKIEGVSHGAGGRMTVG
jgi:hypothetical protein